MSIEKKTDQPKTTVSYYGKKLYVLNPAIAWVKPSQDRGELFHFEDMDNKLRSD